MTMPKLESLCPLLQVFDMPRALAFYCDVLGFEIVQAAPNAPHSEWCWLRRDDVHLMLNTQYEAHQRPPQPVVLREQSHADTTLYLACRDLDAAYAHLKQAGVMLNPAVIRDYGMQQLSFFDPDGYGLCLQWPVNKNAP